ncbi:CDP-glucose 4,6-dehydratase [Orrella sp. 11846]|uniref:CDP-glucose 4,6-dehydratase n=1 Tax=Orrella sp. 11846 TaxID=3409913 RepID=UPI003B5B3987
MSAGRIPEPSFWHGRRVLLTGHTGFKGAWLTWWLTRMGSSVCGLSLAPTTHPNLFSLLGLDKLCDHRIGDIRDEALVRRIVHEVQPEIVLHLAAQALVRTSYSDPLTTFSTNVMGTAHLLDALRSSEHTRVAVMVTTDKVYRNREWVWPYREEDPLGGHDPYSASKAACDIAIECWRLAFLQNNDVAVASARAGNVIGGGDWSVDRLLPDAVRAWLSNEPLSVRRPQAVRPWQHVIEPLAGYLVLAEHLWHHPKAAEPYNFGPHPHEVATVHDVIELAKQAFPKAQVEYGDGLEGPHEAGLLSLDPARARSILGVKPRFTLHDAVERTMNWYAQQALGAHAHELCEADLNAWENLS